MPNLTNTLLSCATASELPESDSKGPIGQAAQVHVNSGALVGSTVLTLCEWQHADRIIVCYLSQRRVAGLEGALLWSPGDLYIANKQR